MKVTLRKAARIRNLLDEHLKGLTVPTRLEFPLNVLSGQTGDLRKASCDEVLRVLDTIRKGCSVLAFLRKEIAKVNQDQGVSDLMTRETDLKRQITILEPLTKLTAYNQANVEAEIQERDRILAAGATDRYSRPGPIKAMLFTKTEIEKFSDELITLKRSAAQIRDDLADLNGKPTMEIPDEFVKFLTDNRVI